MTEQFEQLECLVASCSTPVRRTTRSTRDVERREGWVLQQAHTTP